VQLDLLPDFVVDIFRVVFVFEQYDAFRHTLVIRGNAIAGELLQTVPVCGFKERLGVNRGVAKDPVMPVESFEHRLGDVKADLRR
jgi:hypothetical protein